MSSGVFQIFAAHISLTPAIPSPRSREGRSGAKIWNAPDISPGCKGRGKI